MRKNKRSCKSLALMVLSIRFPCPAPCGGRTIVPQVMGRFTLFPRKGGQREKSFWLNSSQQNRLCRMRLRETNMSEDKCQCICCGSPRTLFYLKLLPVYCLNVIIGGWKMKQKKCPCNEVPHRDPYWVCCNLIKTCITKKKKKKKKKNT